MAARRRRPRIAISSSQSAMRVSRKKLRELIVFVARAQRATIEVIDLAVVSSRQIAALNRRYRRRAGATDVLSFDLTGPEDNGLAAQVIVCGDVAVREARARGHGRQRELMLYVIHGLLHLTGYDDRSPAAARQMRNRQERILAGFLQASSGKRRSTTEGASSRPSGARPWRLPPA